MVTITCRVCQKPYKIEFKIEPEPNKANIESCSIHHSCPYCNTVYCLIIDFTPTNEDAKKKPNIKIEKEDKNYIG